MEFLALVVVFGIIFVAMGNSGGQNGTTALARLALLVVVLVLFGFFLLTLTEENDVRTGPVRTEVTRSPRR